MSAIISDCDRYRYALTRPVGRQEPGELLWVMLNPSTADSAINDPTIRRCIEFTKAFGYDSFSVVNLYGWRTTDPALLPHAEVDAIGEDNDKHLMRFADAAEMILCAWGTKASWSRAGDVIGKLRDCGPLYALKITKDGHPGHPLYLPGTLRPALWKDAHE